MWKRRNADLRQKRTYKTAAEVLAEAAEGPTPLERTTIIDMRGPQVRIF